MCRYPGQSAVRRLEILNQSRCKSRLIISLQNCRDSISNYLQVIYLLSSGKLVAWWSRTSPWASPGRDVREKDLVKAQLCHRTKSARTVGSSRNIRFIVWSTADPATHKILVPKPITCTHCQAEFMAFQGRAAQRASAVKMRYAFWPSLEATYDFTLIDADIYIPIW